MGTIPEGADWPRLLNDAPPRDQLWFRRRRDNRRFLVDLELGWRDGGPALPPGLILGRNVEASLERLMLPVAVAPSFDDLRVPFRCVATDVANGSAVVFERGSLVRAIRASMSLPGVFAPVVVDGRLLVDGGVVDNVPVRVAGDLGADVVIAVDISAPLADPKTLRSLVAISDQVIGILMDENRRRSMDSLAEDDVMIVPDLGDLGVMQFERSSEAIRIGQEAVSALRDRLATFAVDDRAWRAWLPTHVGGTLGLGGIRQDLDGISGSDLLVGGSIFVGADSFIGPACLSFGLTEGGNESLYVFLGPTF